MKKPKGDNISLSSCCGAPLELHVTLYWKCSQCGREIKS